MKANDKLSDSIFADSRAVPIEYAGRWIAWNFQGTRIVASGRTLQEAAAAAAETRPIFAKVPKAEIRFAGLHR